MSYPAKALEEVLITEELEHRPRRSPDHARENATLLALADELALNPKGVLQLVAELAMDLCQSDSAGISILEPGGANGIFRWHAAAGQFAPHLRGTIPRDACPCGVVISRNRPLLFREPQRFFAPLRGLDVRLFECLLVPWSSRGKPVGTLWALSHRPDRHFDSEDARLLTNLSRVASAAWALLDHTRVSDELRSDRTAALNLMEDAIAAETAARSSEEQFRRAIEGAPIPVIMQAEDGQVLQISETWAELTGYTRSDIPTFEAWVNHAYGVGADRVRDHMQRLFTGKTRQLDVEFELLTRTGQRRCWAFSASAPGTLRDGRRFIVGMALDVTERRTMEDALRASREWNRLLIENAREYAIFSLDLDRRIIDWNSGAQQILGYSPQEAIGQSADIIFTAEDRAHGTPEREARTAVTEGRASDQRWHVRRDGSRFWGSGVMMGVRDRAGKTIGLLKIFRDQTAELLSRQALEQSLQETEAARAEAEAAGHAKDHFLAIVSHELRTPLTPILMAAHVISRVPNLPPSVVEGLEMIKRNIGVEGQLIDDLLDFTRIRRGILDLRLERIDVHPVIHRAEEVVRADVEAKEQHLDLDLAATMHQLLADATRLQQVFWNLLRNSSKFTPQGGSITVRSRNEPASEQIPHPRLIVEIIDSGLGFAPEAGERIFDAFAQENREIAREYGGLGLGLAICRAAVAAHGGRIHARSPGPGQGATFTVELPLPPSES